MWHYYTFACHRAANHGTKHQSINPPLYQAILAHKYTLMLAKADCGSTAVLGQPLGLISLHSLILNPKLFVVF